MSALNFAGIGRTTDDTADAQCCQRKNPGEPPGFLHEEAIGKYSLTASRCRATGHARSRFVSAGHWDEEHSREDPRCSEPSLADVTVETAMPRIEDNRIVESATEARGAVTGHNVRYVLLVGTLAVIILFAIAYVATGG